MKKYYKDFIGETIQIFISPYSLYTGEYQALRVALWNKIVNELNYKNGLICDFKEMKTEIKDGKIIVTGTVISCEVDC